VEAVKCVRTLLTVTEPVTQDGLVGPRQAQNILLGRLTALEPFTATSVSYVLRPERIQLVVNVPQASDLPLLR
jgi:hypothetical protein